MSQTFKTTDVLRLEVENYPPSPTINYAVNPSAEANGGWRSNDPNIWLAFYNTSSEVGGTQGTRVRSMEKVAGSSANRAMASMYGVGTSDEFRLPCTPGEKIDFRCEVRTPFTGYQATARLVFWDANQSYLGVQAADPVAVPTQTWTPAHVEAVMPAGAHYVSTDLIVDTISGTSATNGHYCHVDRALILRDWEEPTLPGYFDGQIPATTDMTYGWTGAADNSTSVLVRINSLVNLVGNNNGELGGWGWITPVEGGVLEGVQGPAALSTPYGPALRYQPNVPGTPLTHRVVTEPMPVKPGQYVRALWLHPVTGAWWRVQWVWYDSAKQETGSTTATPIRQSKPDSDYSMGSQQVPAGTAFFALRFFVYKDANQTPAGLDDFFWLRRVTAVATDIPISGTTMRYLEPIRYVNVLGQSHAISVTREELNVGVLTATILDATLDPSQAPLLRPGRKVRLLAKDGAAWSPIFTGTTSKANVTYEVKDPNVPEVKRAKITLTATDAVSTLASQKRQQGVATIAALPYVLEGAGVPWNVNGSGSQVASATVVSLNENASALDQVAVTRDSRLGVAWVDRYGVLQAHDRTVMDQIYSARLLLDSHVSDIDLGYDTERCINEVTLKFLRINPGTGETEEVVYGPYRDESSISQWDVRPGEFTIHGVAEETSALAAYAQAVLDANSTPKVTLNSAQVTLQTIADVASWAARPDLYWRIYPELTRYDLSEKTPDYLPVVGITHTITPDKWLVRFTLANAETVAPPQFVPSPPLGVGGKTIGQLLRPVGEVTQWFGAKADIPAGWLPMDGSTFSNTTYPALAALLDGTTLPNMTDRMPIGAGTKALGTAGGSPTATFTTGAVTSGSGGGTRLNGPTTIDTTGPWRAMWFIIRAV